MSKVKIKDITQGDIFMVNLRDCVANEESGIRPCVCISCNSLTKNRNNVIIAPITYFINHLTPQLHNPLFCNITYIV